MFRKVSSACRDLLTDPATTTATTDDVTATAAATELFSIHDINELFVGLAASEPTLTLQWCNVLILLGYDEEAFWGRVMMSERSYIAARPRYVHRSSLHLR